MFWWRFPLQCALAVLALSVVPSFAQGGAEPPASGGSSVEIARNSAGRLGVEWLGSHDGRREPDRNTLRPRWQGPGALFVEQQAAQLLVRSWWPEQIADSTAGTLIDGLACYLQTRAIERTFDALYLRAAHSVESRQYFGDHVIWSFPTLRLSRQAVASRDRECALFDSLERWLGTPALQSAIYEVAQLPADRLTAAVIVKTISEAAGQDLAWIFDAAQAEISYAVTELTQTSVTVTRKGSGTFTGRTAARVGAFEAGDALRLKVVCEDGSTAWASWDGRDQSRTFRFQGPSPLKAAYLDPDRLITFDRNRSDNAIVPPSPTNVPVRKWVARWMVWLQHTMLSYGMLS